MKELTLMKVNFSSAKGFLKEICSFHPFLNVFVFRMIDIIFAIHTCSCIFRTVRTAKINDKESCLPCLFHSCKHAALYYSKIEIGKSVDKIV